MDPARTVGIPGLFEGTALTPTARSAHTSGSARYCSSRKRSIKRLTKADKEAQQAPNGVAALVDESFHSDDVCLFVPEETGIRLESGNFDGSVPEGLPLCAEPDGDHKGVNVIGATDILAGHKPYYSIHSSRQGVKSQHVGRFVDRFMCTNRDKGVSVILDNYRPRRSIAAEHESKSWGGLYFVFLLSYSPELNLQESIWAWFKDYCAGDSAYTCDKQLFQRIRESLIHAHNTPHKMRRRVDARCVRWGDMISSWVCLPIVRHICVPVILWRRICRRQRNFRTATWFLDSCIY